MIVASVLLAVLTTAAELSAALQKGLVGAEFDLTATEIKVAGSIEDDILKFSVRDNGCGFDPDACPGVLD